MLTEDALQERLDQLQSCLLRSEAQKKDYQEKLKIIRLELANTKGAILELERLLDNQ